MLPTVVAVLVAIIVYDKFVKDLVGGDSFDPSFS